MSKKHGHHGGAWKVAYADFVTAMMALFLVLWLTAQDSKIKEAVERAFRNPFASITKESVGIIPNKDILAVQSREGNFDSASMIELNMLRRLNQELFKKLEIKDENQETFKLEMTPEGLRISIFDRSRKPIFERDSARFTEYGNWVFSTLAWQLSLYSGFDIELEGHTERGHTVARDDYSSWELTTDRANGARRKLLLHGVLQEKIRKVSGYADNVPMADLPPDDEANRRVTVMLKLRTGPSSS